MEKFQLIWQDEFDSEVIDSSKWTHEVGYYHTPGNPNTWGWGNAEAQCYTQSSEESWVENSCLHIRASAKETQWKQDLGHVSQFVSAKLVTKGKFSFRYGRVEVRAKFPKGVGIWPAIWMMPESSSYGEWAASGEIDIVEARGREAQFVQGTIHYGGTWPNNTHASGQFEFPTDSGDIASDFHIYSLDWTEDSLTWSVDGVEYFHLTAKDWYTTASDSKSAPFDQEFYLIINLAIGGYYDEMRLPDAHSIPAFLLVDYVRVYQDKV